MLQPFPHIHRIFEFSIRYCGRVSLTISLKRFMVEVAAESFKKIYRVSSSDRNRPRGIEKSDFELSHILFWKFFSSTKGSKSNIHSFGGLLDARKCIRVVVGPAGHGQRASE